MQLATKNQVAYLENMLGVNPKKLPHAAVKRVCIVLAKTGERFADRMRDFMLKYGAVPTRKQRVKSERGKRGKSAPIPLVQTIRVQNRTWHDKRGGKVLTKIERKIQSGVRILNWKPGLIYSEYEVINPKGKPVTITQ